MRSLFDAGADKVLLHGAPPEDFRSLIEAWPTNLECVQREISRYQAVVCNNDFRAGLL